MIAPCILAAIAATAAHGPEPTWHSVVSNDGSWKVEWRLIENAKPVDLPTPRKRFAVELRITPRRDGAAPVKAAIVDAQMPEHRHGMNVRPSIEVGDAGAARADGMLFHMTGRWEVDVDIDDGETLERAQWDIGMY